MRNNLLLENGFYMTYRNMANNETHSHHTRILRNRYKISIIIDRPGWTREIFETDYFPNEQKVFVLDYNFKLLEPTVKNSYSLKYCGKEQLYDYYVRYINTLLIPKNITWN